MTEFEAWFILVVGAYKRHRARESSQSSNRKGNSLNPTFGQAGWIQTRQPTV